jgi:hypothetical protein
MSDELLGCLSRIADSIEGIEKKMERFVVAIEATKKSNDQWMDGRVTIDASTHQTLLSAAVRLSEHFDQWFAAQGTSRVPIPSDELIALRGLLDQMRGVLGVHEALGHPEQAVTTIKELLDREERRSAQR